MNKIFKYILMITIIMLVVFGTRSCIETISYDKGLTRYYKSPYEDKTITVKCDYASRPYVFCDGKQIFGYNDSGFAETAFFEIEWLSENEVKLFCEQFDEEYFIKLD